MVWTIVLAGGDGARLAEVTRHRYGYARPKQFCDFDGHGTLLDRTIARARRRSAGSRILVVTTRAWRREAEETLDHHPDVVHIEQPRGRDTTPALLLPLVHVLAHDPRSPVVLLPADHLVDDEGLFSAAIDDAVAVVREQRRRVAVLGVEPPRTAVEGYEWLLPADRAPHPAVRAVREVSDDADIAHLEASGALVNTSVLAVRASTLAGMFADLAPDWWEALVGARDLGRVHAAYDTIPSSSFAADVLRHVPDRLSVVRLGAEAGWSDVATPARLARAFSARERPRRTVAGDPAREGSASR